MARGRFITLEGGEGVGKSTQARLLAEVLTARGITVVVTREPGGTPGAEAIRSLLMSGDEGRWNAATEALLFAAARADHVAKLIEPALDRGDWVVCDRFVDSTRAYQGGAGGVAEADIMTLHEIGSGGMLPDRTILLELPLSAGRARVVQRETVEDDRMGGKAADYYERVAVRFRAMAEDDFARFRVISSDAPVDEVAARVLASVEDLL